MENIDYGKTRVQFHVSCRNLPKSSLLTKLQPFVVVLKRDSPTVEWIEACRTESMKSTSNPEFPDHLVIDYRFENKQFVRFEVYSGDHTGLDLDAERFIGAYETNIPSILEYEGKVEKGKLKSKGKTLKADILITGKEVEENLDVFEFQFSAENVDRKNYLGFGKSDPFYEIHQMQDDNSFRKVFRSEKIVANLNPKWQAQELSLQHLCQGDMARMIVIKVYDYKSHGDHYFIGEFMTSVQELLISSTFDLINPKKVNNANYQRSGVFKVKKCSIRKQYSFLKYIQGGLDVNLCIAIDFTANRYAPTEGKKLHQATVDNLTQIMAMNEYQKAILQVGEILMTYDTDKKIPAYGFGGLYGGQVSHCFPLNFNHNDPEVDGIEGVLEAYETALTKVPLTSDSRFGGVIDEVIRLAQKSTMSSQDKYFVLLIVTDGVISDLHETKRLICEAASLPISIVIAGVGKADFSTMEILDGDNVRLSHNGVEAERDIVNFLAMREFEGRSYSALAEETLKELPRQITNYYGKLGVAPKDPTAEAAGHFASINKSRFDMEIVPVAEEVEEM